MLARSVSVKILQPWPGMIPVMTSSAGAGVRPSAAWLGRSVLIWMMEILYGTSLTALTKWEGKVPSLSLGVKPTFPPFKSVMLMRPEESV